MKLKISLFLCAINSLFSLSNAANNATFTPQTYEEMIADNQKSIDATLKNITTVLHTNRLPFETEAMCINDFLETQADIISLRKNLPTNPAALLQKLHMTFLLADRCFTNILIQEELTENTDDCSNEVFEDDTPPLKTTKTKLMQLYKQHIALLMEGDMFKKKHPCATKKEKIEYRDFSCQRLLKGQVSQSLQTKKQESRKRKKA